MITPSPHREVAAPKECATCLGSYSRAQSQQPKRGRSCLPTFSSTPRAELSPRQGRSPRWAGRPAANGRSPPAPPPAGGARGARSPHLTAPVGKPARRPPRSCRLTNSQAAGATATRDFRLPGKPRPLPPAAFVIEGAGPHSRAGPGARGGACRAAEFPPCALRTVPPRGPIPRPKRPGASLRASGYAPGHAMSQQHPPQPARRGRNPGPPPTPSPPAI